MRNRKRQRTVLGVALAAATLLAAQALPASASASTPLPPADYSSRPVCAEPPAGRVACLAEELVPLTAQAQAHTHPLGLARTSGGASPASAATGSYGLRPEDLHSAYELPTTGTGTQTIAIVDAYNDPTAESDLKEYDEEFHLPACTSEGGCFRKVNENGGSSPLPFPQSSAELEAARTGSPLEAAEAEEATGWDLEISLDIETARAVCQSCHILLVEANAPSWSDLESAERAAESLGAGEISNSWGGREVGIVPAQEAASAFNHPGTVITAAAGDDGYLSWAAPSSQRGYAEFPASSPHVVAVGGTLLAPLGKAGSWAGETVWNALSSRGAPAGGGGGCSVEFAAPAWQQDLSDWSAVGCGRGRAVADVAADAAPYSGVAVHDTSELCEDEVEGKAVHWCTIGGTSLASPLIAAVFGLAGGAGAAYYPAHTLYANAAASPGSLHDVTEGSNGKCLLPNGPGGRSGCTPAEAGSSCSSHLICVAGSGYDGPTGIGTPSGLTAFLPAAAGGESEAAEAPSESPEEPVGVERVEAPTGRRGGSERAPPLPPPSPPAPGGTGATASSTGTQVTGLALTLKALIALNGDAPKISQVAFTFRVNGAASLRAVLARHVRTHGRLIWKAMPGALTIHVAAPGGTVVRHLLAHGALRRGTYRLTVTPAHGPVRAVQFHIA
jgi:hypothetical protein